MFGPKISPAKGKYLPIYDHRIYLFVEMLLHRLGGQLRNVRCQTFHFTLELISECAVHRLGQIGHQRLGVPLGRLRQLQRLALRGVYDHVLDLENIKPQ